jgi:hypothetical protein
MVVIHSIFLCNVAAMTTSSSSDGVDGATTTSSSSNGIDGLLTHLSWDHQFCSTRKARRSWCVTLPCRDTCLMSLHHHPLRLATAQNSFNMERGLHIGLNKSGLFHAASRVAARWAWEIGDYITGSHNGLSIAIDSAQIASFSYCDDYSSIDGLQGCFVCSFSLFIALLSCDRI